MSFVEYDISGPTQIGSVGNLNRILGDLRMSDVTVSGGGMITTDSSNFLKSIDPPANTSIFIYDPNNTNMNQSWVRTGTTGDVLQITGTNTIGWTNVNSEASSVGMMVHKNGNFVLAAPATTPANITGWIGTTPDSGEFNSPAGQFSGLTGILTIQSNGLFQINAGFKYLTNNGDGTRNFRLLRNNNVTLMSSNVEARANSTILENAHLSGTFQLNRTDRLVLQTYQTNGLSNTNITIVGGRGSWFSMNRLAVLP